MMFQIPPLIFVFNIIGGDHGSSVDGRDDEILAKDQQRNICLHRSPGLMLVPHRRQQVRCHMYGLVGDRSDSVVADPVAKGTA